MPVLADDLAVARLAADVDDLRIGTDALVVRVDEDVAEAAGGGLVPIDVEGLVTEEDHALGEQRLADFANRPVVEFLGHVDTVDLGPDRAGDRLDLDMCVAHWRFLPTQRWPL